MKPFRVVHSRPIAPGVAAAPIGRAAIRALYAELALHPKPGLVSPLDSGSHDDMDMTTFMRSLFALRGYYRDIAAAGARGADFATLQALGIAAERRMLAATGGINTHRGAVFGLGLLAAAAGWLHQTGKPLGGQAFGDAVATQWGDDILAASPRAPDSHGAQAIRRYGARGAGKRRRRAFRLCSEVALPTLARTFDILGCDGAGNGADAVRADGGAGGHQPAASRRAGRPHLRPGRSTTFSRPWGCVPTRMAR